MRSLLRLGEYVTDQHLLTGTTAEAHHYELSDYPAAAGRGYDTSIPQGHYVSRVEMLFGMESCIELTVENDSADNTTYIIGQGRDLHPTAFRSSDWLQFLRQHDYSLDEPFIIKTPHSPDGPGERALLTSTQDDPTLLAVVADLARRMDEADAADYTDEGITFRDFLRPGEAVTAPDEHTPDDLRYKLGYDYYPIQAPNGRIGDSVFLVMPAEGGCTEPVEVVHPISLQVQAVQGSGIVVIQDPSIGPNGIRAIPLRAAPLDCDDMQVITLTMGCSYAYVNSGPEPLIIRDDRDHFAPEDEVAATNPRLLQILGKIGVEFYQG
jgi:hypothetical protein